MREHYRFLLRSAWALMGSRAVAEDVVQDCFTNAWKHRKRLHDPAVACAPARRRHRGRPRRLERGRPGREDPHTLTLAEPKARGLDTVAMALQCSGNGRGFFPSKPSGTLWTVGTAGCVVWSGVLVRAVVGALGGMAAGMKYRTRTSGEVLPDGIDPQSVIVERSVPATAVEDALLAWS